MMSVPLQQEKRRSRSKLTVRAKVYRAVRDVAAFVVADPDGQVVTVDERNVVPVAAISGAECELSEGRRRDTLQDIRGQY